MHRGIRVERLSDELSQYDLMLKCEACGNERHVVPRSLANDCGWDALGEVTVPTALLELP